MTLTRRGTIGEREGHLYVALHFIRQVMIPLNFQLSTN